MSNAPIVENAPMANRTFGGYADVGALTASNKQKVQRPSHSHNRPAGKAAILSNNNNNNDTNKNNNKNNNNKQFHDGYADVVKAKSGAPALKKNNNDALQAERIASAGDKMNAGVVFGLDRNSYNKLPHIESATKLLEPSASIDPRNYEDVQRVASAVRQLAHLDETPRIGIICGSGLGAMAELLRDSRVVPFSSIPGFPQTNVVGHKGNLVFGWLKDAYVMCLQGRFHPYEHQMNLALCSMPVRIMHELGVVTLFVSNAAGGMNTKFRSGDLMIIKDHISMPALVGFGPLVGLHDPRFGPRFVSVHDAYDKEMRALALSVAEELRVPVHEGIYVMNGGPQYETPAEISFLKAVGGDAVGMSTCHEVIVARQCGMRVFGFSLITNVCHTSLDAAVEVSHEEVIQTGRDASERACNFVGELVERMASANLHEPRIPRVDSYQVHASPGENGSAQQL